VKPLAFIAVPALTLAACSSGNDRTYIGNPDLRGGATELDGFREPARPELPPTPDQPTLISIDRSNWAPQVMVSQVDGVSATRAYSMIILWSDATARQRGQMPTAVSSLELSEDSETDQFWEGVASWPLSFVGGVLILPRMITHSPTREVRFFPRQYWRAPVDTPRQVPDVAAPVDVTPTPPTPAPSNS
jgi:hypothetical protein